MHSRAFQSLLIVLSTLCAVQADTNYFIKPPTNGITGDFSQNEVYQIGQTVDLQWSTNYNKISLYLWQNNNNSAITLLGDVNAVQSEAWKIDLNGWFDLDNGNVFFFQLYEGNTENLFSSHYFNITESTSTTSSSTSSVTATSTLSTAASGTAANAAATNSAQSPSSSSQDNSDNSGLSSGAEIGIGVGVGVGAAAIIAAIAAFFFMRRRKSKAATANAKQWQDGSAESSQMAQIPHDGYKSAYNSQPPDVYAHYGNGGSASGYHSPAPAYQPLPQHQAPTAELSGEHVRSELGGQDVRSELGGENAASELGTKP